jgi:hypothetical protein
VVKNRIIRGAIAGSAVLIPFGGVTALAVNPAAAQPTGIACNKVIGTINTVQQVIHPKICTGTTGGMGTIHTTVNPPSHMTVDWLNGRHTKLTTNFSAGTLCTPSSTLLADEVLSGAVHHDTTGSTTIGAAVSAEFCVSSTSTSGVYTITNAPGTKFVIAP